MKKGKFPARLLRLWLDPRVSREKKLVFPLLIAVYWILPDVMPFLPIDDLLFAAMMAYLFSRSAEKDVPGSVSGKNPKTVDAQGEVLDNTKDED